VTFALTSGSPEYPHERQALWHRILPPGVAWQNIIADPNAMPVIDTHVVVVWIPSELRADHALAVWARKQREHTNYTVGLIVSDEMNLVGSAAFGSFDYVLRHYYQELLHENYPEDPQMYLRALGNMTCGTGVYHLLQSPNTYCCPSLLSLPGPDNTLYTNLPNIAAPQFLETEAAGTPRFGVHWVFLLERGPVTIKYDRPKNAR
jgi:hypothetical protein